MRKILTCISLFLILAMSMSAQKVGLVLSGGGAKGAAHLGVIKALEENDIPIDYITGTSIGAIVGALYAIGYTPDEMLELFLSDDFASWQSGKVEVQHRNFFVEKDITSEFFQISLDFSDSLQVKAHILPSSLINPIQMNQAFMGLFAQATAKSGWNFNNLFVPFRCVAADVYNKKPVVFRSGDIGDAVRASMTFPLVFKPIWKDSVPLFDGGIYDNFPTSVMRNDFRPDFIFGSIVAGKQKKPNDKLYDQLETMIMQKTDYSVSEEEGMVVQFSFPDISLLDFPESKALMDSGYHRTLAMIDSIKARVPERITREERQQRRQAFKNSLPPLKFKNVIVRGVTNEQRTFIENEMHRDINGEFSMEEFKRVYFRILASGKIQEIRPQAVYNYKERSFDLYLNATIRKELDITIGGNISSHQANQLYLGLGYDGLRRYATSLDLNFQMGNSFSGAMFNARLFLHSKIPSYLNIRTAYSFRKYSESQSLFYEDVLPSFIKQKEMYAKLSYAFPIFNKAKIELVLGIARQNDFYYQTSTVDFSSEKYDRSLYNLYSASFFVHRNSLNFKQYPTSGRLQYLSAGFYTGNEEYKPYFPGKHQVHSKKNLSWFQVNAKWHHYHSFNKSFSLGVNGEVYLSNKRLMNNYTSSILHAPAFTPTPHSLIVFNEAFRANQYGALGLIPIYKFNDMFSFRLGLYGFAPLKEIKKSVVLLEDKTYLDEPYYGKVFRKFHYMGEAALVFQIPSFSVSVYANGYSYPRSNFNFGINIGYLIFNQKFTE